MTPTFHEWRLYFIYSGFLVEMRGLSADGDRGAHLTDTIASH